MDHSIIIIGGGNMGGAMARALHRAEAGVRVSVVEADATRCDSIAAEGITTYSALGDAPPAACYVLAIKPQQFADYSATLKAAIAPDALLISIMAGIPLLALTAVCPRAVRAMPNLPAIVGESMSVLCAPEVDVAAQQFAEAVFAAIGAVAWVQDEAQLHAVTAISGSGPAYFFAFMEALEQAAIAEGLDAVVARQLVLQTAIGAALLAEKNGTDVRELRTQVTSKGGTTEAALMAFHQGDFQGVVARAVKAAILRSRALSS